MKPITKHNPRTKLTNPKKDTDTETPALVHPATYQVKEWNIDSAVIENMRLLIAHIQKVGSIPHRLSILSALNGEGSTSVCLGLGVTLANDYKASICIVDLNWYKPSSLLQISAGESGIVDVLNGRCTIDEVIKPVGERLYILPGGKIDEDQCPVLSRSHALIDLLARLDEKFDYIIMDIPAVLSTSDAIQLASYGNGCILVVQHGVTPVHDVKLALDEISHLNVLGVVINRATIKTPPALLKILAG